jgi:hypothetical protein
MHRGAERKTNRRRPAAPGADGRTIACGAPNLSVDFAAHIHNDVPARGRTLPGDGRISFH